MIFGKFSQFRTPRDGWDRHEEAVRRQEAGGRSSSRRQEDDVGADEGANVSMEIAPYNYVQDVKRLHKHQHIMPHLAGIQLGPISIDDPRLFELRHAAQAGGWRQPDRRCQIHIRDPRIILKCTQNRLINPVHMSPFPLLWWSKTNSNKIIAYKHSYAINHAISNTLSTTKSKEMPQESSYIPTQS